MSLMLKINQLSCGYEGKTIIKNISMDIKKGQMLCLIGPNGCGKTTLLKAIANLLDYEGEILLEGQQIKKMKRKQLAQKIAFMTQSSDMYFPYSVYETVSVGRYAHSSGLFSTLSKKDHEIILNCLKRVGLDGQKDKLINELSGGQLQRVHLARAFAQEPDIILLDEPTNHLDLKYQIELLQYINQWTKEHHKTVIAVLHDLNLVQMFSDEVVMIKEGRVVASGHSQHVLDEKSLIDVYGINIKNFMLAALEKWK